MFWVSSWFPTSPDKWDACVAAVSIFGLIAAHLAQKRIGELSWPAKATSALAYAVLIGGLNFILTRVTERSPVDAGNTFFFVFGGMGYLFLVRTILAPRQTQKRYRGTGLVVLSLLAIWSWTSAISMYSLRGADR
jgi:hypothetical protein